MIRRVTAVLLFFVALVPTPSVARQPAVEQDGSSHARSAASGLVAPLGTWRVATREVPPFAFRDETGTWRGIAIDLWTKIAAEHGFATELVESDIAGMIQGVAEGRFDAAVGAVTVTAQRESMIDFTQPFFSGGLGIAAADRDLGWLGSLRRLLSPAFWRVVVSLGLLLALAGLLAWIFERRHNAEQFGGSLAHGIGAGFWWAAVTMTTVGYGDKAPRTAAGRLVALVWMFASLIVISTFTAAITSALTVGQLAATVKGAEDLPRVRVGTLASTTGASWLESAGIRYTTYESSATALRALADDRLDAVVYDQPILQHQVQAHHAGKLTVLPQVLATELYAFVLPPGSPHREAIDRSLLLRTQGEDWQRQVDSYLDR